MQANPSKFQALILGANLKNSNVTFDVGGAKISPSPSVNLLGVEIDEKLSFAKHISNICSKAGKQLSALARLSKILDTNTKLLILNSFILSNFNYCPLVWHHCSIASTRKIEKLQERGLRFAFNDSESSYSELLLKAGKSMLYIGRIKKIALFVFKCINNIGPPSVHDLYKTKSLSYSLRDPHRIEQPLPKTSNYGLNTLKYSGAAIWNKMPSHIKNTIEFQTYKRLIKTWTGPSCYCGVCTMCKISQT